jgi:hypothetical protein
MVDNKQPIPFWWRQCPPPPPACPGRRVEDEPMDVDVLGIDLGKKSCSVVGLDGACGAASAVAAGEHRSASGKAVRLHGRDGAALGPAPPRTAAGRAGTRGAANVAGICSSLRKGAEERRPRRGGDRRAATRPTLRFVTLNRGSARCSGSASRTTGWSASVRR